MSSPTPPTSTFRETFFSLLRPWQFMLTALSYLPPTLFRLLTSPTPTSIPYPDNKPDFSPSRIKHHWFTAFWSWAGPQIRLMSGPRISALLEGRVTNGAVVEGKVNQAIGGVVLDIGPGLGFWVDLYRGVDVDVAGDGKSRATPSAPGASGISKIYGIEPNIEAHAELRQRVEKAGLSGVYEILPVGIEALGTASVNGVDGVVKKGSVDAIVSLLCLCSIPEPERNIRELYGYLKKGGRWYVFEHVRIRRRGVMRWYQAFINIFWPHVIGGCDICRDTEQSLRNAGEWEKIDLAQPPEEMWHATVPHVFGVLTK